MNPELVENILALFAAVSAAGIAYVLASEYHSAAEEFRSSQLQAGDQTLSELYISMSPQTLLALRIAAVGLFFMLGLWAVNFAAGAFLGAVAYVVPGMMLRSMREKRVHQVEQQLVEALELLGNSLKSGLTMQQALELVVREFPPPIKQEFMLVLSECRLGVELTDALANMAKRLKSNIVQILAAGVTITKKVGGDLTVIFNNIAATIREQANIEGKLNAVTAQGRFQGLILGLMPFALCILLFFIDRPHIEALFGYQLGLFAFAIVCGMVVLAQLWIRKLLDIDV
jgi:tight adherence protein B